MHGRKLLNSETKFFKLAEKLKSIIALNILSSNYRVLSTEKKLYVYPC